jgi:parallel beta-helix repeat protein
MQIRMRIRVVPFLLLLSAFLATQVDAFAAVIRVKPGGNDANSGADWTSAKATLTAAITAAAEGDQIWVATGAYHERIASRVVGGLAVNVALYGGFAGTETSLGQRNFSANITTINGSGGGPVVRITDNASPGTRVDGFTITNGTVGISIFGAAPTITNNIIRANAGQGIYCTNYQILGVYPPIVAFPVITYNTIADNSAGNGAGIAVVGTQDINILPSSAPLIEHNIIVRNRAGQNGGGIGSWGHASPVIAYNYIAANTASAFETGWDSDSSVGSWIVGGGGIFSTKNDMGGQPIQYAIAAPTIINNMVIANGGWLGGGISLVAYPYEPLIDPENNPPPVVTNNTIVANNGAGIYWQSSFPVLRNNLVAFNTWGLEQDTVSVSYPSVGYNNVYGNILQTVAKNYKGIANQTGMNGNISADPLLANYLIGELHLQPGSPCIDAGLEAATQGGWTDYEGQARKIGAGVDIGADESDGTQWDTPGVVIHVSPSGSDSQSGLTWGTAKKTLTSGIFAAASQGGEVWVAAGTYSEHITIPAFVYLYGGFSGTETTRTQRSVSTNATVIDGGGIPTIVAIFNAGYLVSALDGFTVQNGGFYTNGSVPGGPIGFEGRGAGIRSAVASSYIYNNTIRWNSLGDPYNAADKRAHGAGIHGYLNHSIFAGNILAQNEILNIIDGAGGGMYFKLSMPTIEANYFLQNHAHSGSAVYGTLSAPRIGRNVIYSNAMYDNAPPLYMGSVEGAITLNMGDTFLIEGNLIYANKAATGAGIHATTNLAGRIENNVIAYNEANDALGGGGMGGGIYALAPLIATESLYIVNNTIFNNTGSVFLGEEGGGIAVSIPPKITGPDPIPDRIIIANNIIAFNTSGIFETLTTPMVPPTLVKNDFYNGSYNYVSVPAGASDLTVDPKFINRTSGDLRLVPLSPCVDAGDNSLAPTSSSIDYGENPRIYDGNRDGSAVVDLGAYEYYIRQPGSIDFDGDLKGDIAVWRQNAGVWYVLPSRTPQLYTAQQWGLETDKPVPADYDADGKTDVAVWRPGSGIWYVLSSGTPGSYTSTQWGVASDKPVPGDYDRDGKSDIAVWRPDTGTWYVQPSATPGSYNATQWGVASDIPVPADYDGDGKTDIAVWRPGSGIWYALPSGTPGSYTATQWGVASDKPVPADYDGDGKSDIAVWRPDTGTWYVIPSGTPGPYGATQWGLSTDIPVTSDFDGDAMNDIAVYRPSSGQWYILPSGQPGSFTAIQWGVEVDIPISAMTGILRLLQ